MKERRRLERRYLNYPLRVLDSYSNQLIGYIENITVEGIMLKSNQSFQINNRYQFKVLFGKEIHKTGHFEFSAECKWYDKDIYTGFYNAGFHLEDVSFEGIQILENIIDRLC